jgi:hypothetical protein
VGGTAAGDNLADYPTRVAPPPVAASAKDGGVRHRGRRFQYPEDGNPTGMIFLGIILLIIGFVLAIHILWIIGIILLVVGLILALLGGMGRTVGGRSHYY